MIRRPSVASAAVQLARQSPRSAIHSSAATLVYKKKANTDFSANNLFKRGTPKKTAGSIHDFKNTAAHTRLGRLAPELIPSVVVEESLNSEEAAAESAEADFESVEAEAETEATNEALDAAIPGTEILSLEAAKASPGTFYRYPAHVRNSLAIFGSFKRDQRNELFRYHGTLIRESTSVPMLDTIEKGTQSASSENRVCLLGDRGVGKSTLVAHAQAFGLMSGYVVVSVPHAEMLVSGKNDALFSQSFEHFAQPMYVRHWMKQIARANKDVLSQIPVSKDWNNLPGASGKSYQPHSPKALKSLYNFLLEGRRRRDAFVVMDEFLQELEAQVVAPVLFTLDDINVFTDKVYSLNRDTSNHRIYHGDLQVPRYFLDFLSGKRSFQRGVVLTATSGKFRTTENNCTIEAGLGHVPAPAYSKISYYDEKLAANFAGVSSIQVPRYTLKETGTTLKYLSSAQVLQVPVSSHLVDERYLLSGNGNPRDLLRTCNEASF